MARARGSVGRPVAGPGEAPDRRRRPRIARRAARAWRVARTGVAFACYGVGAVVLAFAVLPLQRLTSRLAGRRGGDDLRAQRAIHRGSRLFVWIMEGLRLLRVHETGTDALAVPGRLVVANHPSLIDTPLLTRRMPQADFVVSPGWSRNPYLRGAAAAAGYLRAEGGEALVREAAARLRAGRSLVLFPEGSRTPVDGLGRFQRGAAHIALEAGCELLPVTIRVSPRTLMKGQRWSDTPERSPDWWIEVGAPIRPADHVPPELPRARAARRLTAVLREHFQKRVQG